AVAGRRLGGVAAGLPGAGGRRPAGPPLPVGGHRLRRGGVAGGGAPGPRPRRAAGVDHHHARGRPSLAPGALAPALGAGARRPRGPGAGVGVEIARRALRPLALAGLALLTLVLGWRSFEAALRLGAGACSNPPVVFPG